jgi:CPA1 family monovalent cation:H+ antiporter
VPAALLPRILSKRIREKEQFDKRNMVIFGWAGMRGVVSMAAALALPLTMADGTKFPMRDLLIFLTFFVILVTLVLPGLTLPWIIRKLKLPRHSIVDEEYEVRTHIVSNTSNHIAEKLPDLKPELLSSIKNKYEIKYNRLQRTELPAGYFEGKKIAPGASIFNELNKVQLDLIGVERDNLQQLHRNGKTSEEIIRKIERELDLEEAKLRMEMYEE